MFRILHVRDILQSQRSSVHIGTGNKCPNCYIKIEYVLISNGLILKS